jgi:quercetin 2,3-dioxygenase
MLTPITVWKGSVTVGQNGQFVDTYNTAVLTSEGNGVAITSASDETDFILVSAQDVASGPSFHSFCQVAGEPLDQTVVQYGPFVMTSRDDIHKTLIDCK